MIMAKGDDNTLDFKAMTNDQLHQVMREARELLGQAHAELNRWSIVRCYICQRDNVCYRDEPFYGWTTSSGYILCHVCTNRWEGKYKTKLTGIPTDNPVDEIMALLD